MRQRNSFRLGIQGFMCLLLFCFLSSVWSSSRVDVVTIDGGIGPAVADYVVKSIDRANQRSVALIVLRMDTPGGLSASMRRMIKSILSSKVPVVGFVSPSGARAASAGTYLLYAAHLAAMAPGTNLGAATPVNLFGGDKGEKEGAPTADDKASGKATGSALKQKMINDSKAYIRSLAQLRGRNVQWAEEAVTKAASLSASEALSQGVINLIAKDLPSLLEKVNGQTVSINGQSTTLSIPAPTITVVQPTWQEQFLIWITNPSMTYILLMIGIYGLFFEFSNPGLIVPGVIGAIALLIAVYALQMLPVNFIGLALLLLGIAFIVMEAFMPSFGVLGIGGIVAMIFGSIMLFDISAPGMGISLHLVLTVSLVTAALFAWLLFFVIRSRQRRVVSGVEGMIGGEGVMEKNGSCCWLRYRGELWQVRDPEQRYDGERVRILHVKNHIVDVESSEDKTKE